ncbi:hypothetical protein RB2077 [Rhodopirellula baltica SH 1]|uniref:Uncharacterized protein n=1 Tax=Rhodopirellula baltica (strain DSM 10527 / NCIMB 13988 / SH1) TaxID=243090 RepID=Q7UWF4_RHOBA|nr:hypothetical protein RB2077 [Rhodopirellula baltica SH 1]
MEELNAIAFWQTQSPGCDSTGLEPHPTLTVLTEPNSFTLEQQRCFGDNFC